MCAIGGNRLIPVSKTQKEHPTFRKAERPAFQGSRASLGRTVCRTGNSGQESGLLYI